jgi:outer membrane protein assembly factor BamB
MKRLTWLVAVVVFLGVATTSQASVKYLKWHHPHGGSRGNLAAIDLTAGKVLWEARLSKSINFVQETTVGILVGSDAGELILLRASDGGVIWKTALEKNAEIKIFHSETEEGFLVASGDQFFWLVDKSGKLILHCGDKCLPR